MEATPGAPSRVVAICIPEDAEALAVAGTTPYPPPLDEVTATWVIPPTSAIEWVLPPTPASENIYLTQGGVADDELAEPLVQSEEGGDVAAEGTEHFLQNEGDAEEVVELEQRRVRGEGDDESIVITLAEEWLGVEWAPDDVSVTTGCTVTTQMLADSHFAHMRGPSASTLPVLGVYHADEYEPSIEEELKRDVALVLNAPHSAYNWIGLVTTTPFPWHTS